MGKGREAVIEIACIQMEPVVGEREANLRKSLGMIEEAAGHGARLIVLPELCNSGYVFESRDEAFALAEPVPDGPTGPGLVEIAARRDLHIVAGIGERAGDVLYNCSVVIGPRPHRHLPQGAPVERGEPLLRAGRPRLSGVQDAARAHRHVHLLRRLVPGELPAVGAPGRRHGLHARPTGCRSRARTRSREAMANILCMAAAHSNSVFVAAADRVGTERGQPFIGQSLIVSYTGWPIGGPASADREEIVYAERQPRRRQAQAQLERVQPGAARSARRRLCRDAGRRCSAGLVLNDRAWRCRARMTTRNGERQR